MNMKKRMLATLTALSLSCMSTAMADNDEDKLEDYEDNCTEVFNPDQIDADNDGFGNVCDPDLNNDGIVNIVDLGLFRTVYFTNDAVADFNSDGIVNIEDLATIRSYFFSPPGPSGLTDP